MNLDRRTFIKLTSSIAAGLSLGGIQTVFAQNGMPYRKLGLTGLNVSLLTVGGSHIGGNSLTDNEAVAIMRTAVDEGINFFDNAWHYHSGRSEERMGKALKDGYRDKVILMTKHHGRDPETARDHLEESLRRLQTDRIDVWQFHEVVKLSEVDRIYSSGVLDFALKMKEEGKIGFIGFTGHAHPKVHKAMIDRGFNWDTVQMPVNILDHHYLSFTNEVVPMAARKNIGIIAMKTLAGGAIHRRQVAEPRECLRFAMTMPVSTVCSGMDSLRILRENISVAKNFKPMTEQEIRKLVNGSVEASEGGKNEWYKSTDI